MTNEPCSPKPRAISTLSALACGPRSLAQLARSLGEKPSAIRQLLTDMFSEGWVEVIGAGSSWQRATYRATPAGMQIEMNAGLAAMHGGRA